MSISEHKTPYWLSQDEFNLLHELMSNENFSGEHYDGIREELGVAKTRAKTSRISTHSLIVALGLVKGSIPVHLSDAEVKLIQGLEELPKEVKARLL